MVFFVLFFIPIPLGATLLPSSISLKSSQNCCYVVKPADREAIIKAFDCFDHLKPIAEELRRSSSSVNG